MITIETRISGIPCQVVAEYVPACRGYREPGGRQLEPDEPAGHELVRVLDRKGYRAGWLENKMSAADEDRIRRELREMMG